MLTILAPEQQRQLAADVAAAVLQALEAKHAGPRLAYSLREVAELTGFSRTYVYRCAKNGSLPTVRPGAGSEQRVLPQHLKLWLWGQVNHTDEPAMGVAPKVAMQHALKRLRKK